MTPLFKKLNLGTLKTILVLNAPESFEDELSQLDDVNILRRATAKTTVGFALGFAMTQVELDQLSTKLANAADGDAVVWIAYPKGSSKRYSCDFNRDTGWKVIGSAGFEPVRQVAIDEDWSALRFRKVDHIASLTRKSAISNEGKRRIKK